LLEAAQNPTVHRLEKLHDFPMKMRKNHWQIGTLTSPILSRWHVDNLIERTNPSFISQGRLLKYSSGVEKCTNFVY